MTLTWRRLAEEINKLSDELKDTDVSIHIYDVNETYQANSFQQVTEDDRDIDQLDVSHPYLLIN